MNIGSPEVNEAYSLHSMLEAEFKRRGIDKAVIFAAVAQIVIQINHECGGSPEELADSIKIAAKEHRRLAH